MSHCIHEFSLFIARPDTASSRKGTFQEASTPLSREFFPSDPTQLYCFPIYPSFDPPPPRPAGNQLTHINNRHTPKIIAAVPVQTPINHCKVENFTASNRSRNAAHSCSILVSVSLIFKS